MNTPTDQWKLWNGPAGNAWVDAQNLLDQMFRPMEAILAESASGDVLDIGCGTGATTLAIATQAKQPTRCTGLDISEPMIAAARLRAERAGVPIDFLCANAETHPFQPQAFDRIVSRFGVMFFDDPVRAFANLHTAARPGAELRFLAWRSPAENLFMTTAERAAAPLLPNLPVRRPDTPGQFAFADANRVQTILANSGWQDIQIEPIDIPCAFPANDLDRYFTRLGPIGLALPEADPETRTRVIDAVRAAFAPYIHGPEVRFDSACWLVRARNA